MFHIHRPPRDPNIHQCRICRRYHPLKFCKRFLAMSVPERKKKVRLLGYCTNCLATSHETDECISDDVCRRCGWTHHTLLHQSNRVILQQKKHPPPKREVSRNRRAITSQPPKTSRVRVPRTHRRQSPECHRRSSNKRTANSKRILQEALHALQRLQQSLWINFKVYCPYWPRGPRCLNMNLRKYELMFFFSNMN